MRQSSFSVSLFRLMPQALLLSSLLLIGSVARAQQPVVALAAAPPAEVETIQPEPAAAAAKPLVFQWATAAASAAPVTVPVTLTDLRATRPAYDAPGVVLYWATGQEQCNAVFVVERRTEGETAFHRVARVPGQGSSTMGHNYAFVDDANREPKISYYRLHQLDSDGSLSTCSPELAVQGLPLGLPLPEKEE